MVLVAKKARMINNNPHNPGSFLSGFSVGLFAGAAGLFLFGTDNGKKLRKELNEEWDGAKESLAKEGIIENADESLGEVLKSLFKKATTTADQKEVTTKSVKPKRKKRSSEKTHKFRGV